MVCYRTRRRSTDRRRVFGGRFLGRRSAAAGGLGSIRTACRSVLGSGGWSGRDAARWVAAAAVAQLTRKRLNACSCRPLRNYYNEANAHIGLCILLFEYWCIIVSSRNIYLKALSRVSFCDSVRLCRIFAVCIFAYNFIIIIMLYNSTKI